jgi:hypothetical protein
MLQLESSYQKTSASSENKKHFSSQKPALIKTKVRDFGTPDSRSERHRNLDVLMKNESPVRAAGIMHEKEMSLTEANGAFQDAEDKVDFHERTDNE